MIETEQQGSVWIVRMNADGEVMKACGVPAGGQPGPRGLR